MNKKATIKDIARAAETSPQTVSRVMTGKGYVKEETRKKVEAAAQQLGYRPNRAASSLVTGRTMTIGIVVPTITSSYFGAMVLGAEEVARKAGYITFLTNSTGRAAQEGKIIDFLHDTNVDGLILCSPRMKEEELLLMVSRQKAVVISRPIPIELGGSILSDNIGGMHQAVEHLLKTGRKVIGLLTGEETIYSASARLRGYMQAMRSLNQPIDPELIVSFETVREIASRNTDEHRTHQEQPHFLWEEMHSSWGRQGVTYLLNKRPDVDAIICFDDQQAFGALQGCAALGKRVPEDVAIIGCNDLYMARQTNPPLSTLHIPSYQIGASAGKMLIDMINGKPAQRLLFDQPLVIRQSSLAGSFSENVPGFSGAVQYSVIGEQVTA